METNRIDGIARDGIHTASQIARTAVQSGGELTGEIAVAASKVARDSSQIIEDSSIVILSAAGRVLGATRQVGEQAIGLARTMLGSALEVAGSVARTAVRVTAEVAIEVVDSVRSTVAALFAAPVDREPQVSQTVRATNGGPADLAA